MGWERKSCLCSQAAWPILYMERDATLDTAWQCLLALCEITMYGEQAFLGDNPTPGR